MASLQLNLLLFFIKLSKLKAHSYLPLAACIQLPSFFASVDLLEVSPVGRNHLACIDGLQEKERGGELGQQSLRLKRLVVPSICFFSRVIPSVHKRKKRKREFQERIFSGGGETEPADADVRLLNWAESIDR